EATPVAEAPPKPQTPAKPEKAAQAAAAPVAKAAPKTVERAAKKPAEVRPEPKKAVSDGKPVHVDRPAREHPAAAASAAAASAAPTAPPKEKPTIRFGDVRRTHRYESPVPGEPGPARLAPEPPVPPVPAERPVVEPARPAE